MLEQLFYCTIINDYEDITKYDMIKCTTLFGGKNERIENKN